VNYYTIISILVQLPHVNTVAVCSNLKFILNSPLHVLSATQDTERERMRSKDRLAHSIRRAGDVSGLPEALARSGSSGAACRR